MTAAILEQPATQRLYKFTRAVITELTRRMLNQMANIHGGKRTLNELRVFNQVVAYSLVAPEVSMSLVRKKVGMKQAVISKVVQNLVEHGHLVKRINPDDERRRIIVLTPASRVRMKSDIDELLQFISSN